MEQLNIIEVGAEVEGPGLQRGGQGVKGQSRWGDHGGRTWLPQHHVHTGLGTTGERPGAHPL